MSASGGDPAAALRMRSDVPDLDRDAAESISGLFLPPPATDVQKDPESTDWLHL